MSVRMRLASEQTRQVLLDSQGFLHPGDPSPEELSNAPWDHPVYVLGLRQIMSGDRALPDTPSSWRFLAPGESGRGVAATLSRRRGAAPRMTSLWRGPQVDKAIQAIREIESLPQVDGADYELRVLRIPGLLIEAYWLKSLGSGSDLVLPYLTLSKELQAMKPYPMDDFVQIVRPLAEKQLKLEASLESAK